MLKTGSRLKMPRITVLDCVLSVLFLAGILYTVYRLQTVLTYKWDWKVIPQYLVRYNGSTGRWVPNLLMQGLLTTLRLSIWTILLATSIGIAAGLCRTSHRLFRRLVGSCYVQIIRNIPPLVLIFIFYFFLGNQLIKALHLDEFVMTRSKEIQETLALLAAPPGTFSAFVSAVLTLGIYEGAYIAEIVRAGIQSIEKGQWEASSSLGLSRWQQMRHVILPQALRRMLPPLAGQFISTIKDSSIVSVISIQELTFQGLEIMAATYRAFEIWITITAMYFLVTVCCSIAASRLERRLGGPANF